MTRVAVTGATGFIGAHLVRSLAESAQVRIRTLARRPDAIPPSPRIEPVAGDLRDAGAVEAFVRDVDVLVNLAYPDGWSQAEHIEAARALSAAAARAGVRRIVHVSTAVVAGDCDADRVTETTRERPKTEYERTKLALEEAWREKTPGELCILRPTAVFGPGGKNLLTVVGALTRGRGPVDYVRACVYGRRRMHLVSVRNVVAAIEFAVRREQPSAVDTFIVSEDDVPENNYLDVEAIVADALAIPPRAMAPLRLPPAILACMLRLRGRSDADPRRNYDSSKLTAAGWTRPHAFVDELKAFAHGFRHEQRR